MLKKDITYTDFDDNEHTETFYFNLSKSEIVELEVERNEGFSDWIQNIIKAEDNKTIIEQFKGIILRSVGQKSEDGKQFIKNDAIRDAFAQSNAYDELFVELATVEDAGSAFLLGILPKDIARDVQEQSDQDKPALPPRPNQ